MTDRPNKASSRGNIFGVGISAVSLAEAVRYIQAYIENGARHYVSVCTVHTIMEARQSTELRVLLNRSFMSTPDGMPLVWLTRRCGFENVTRVYGPDLVEAFCEQSASKGYRHYFDGGAEGVVEELCGVMTRRYPGLQIAGAYSPFQEGRRNGVAGSARSHQRNTARHRLGGPGNTQAGLLGGSASAAPPCTGTHCGGGRLRFFHGKGRQAPRWVQRSGLEWLFRLCMEPRRLAYRYLVYNPLFVAHVSLQMTGLQLYEMDGMLPIERSAHSAEKRVGKKKYKCGPSKTVP